MIWPPKENKIKIKKVMREATAAIRTRSLGLSSRVIARKVGTNVSGSTITKSEPKDKIAKSMQQQNTFGKELDSLSDTVSFGVAPAIFGFSLMQFASNFNQLQVTFGVIAFTIFLFCGILRLARYNIMDIKGAFQGMPITLNGIIIPLAYFLNISIKFYPYIYLTLGILMVSSFRVKKLP